MDASVEPTGNVFQSLFLAWCFVTSREVVWNLVMTISIKSQGWHLIAHNTILMDFILSRCLVLVSSYYFGSVQGKIILRGMSVYKMKFLPCKFWINVQANTGDIRV